MAQNNGASANRDLRKIPSFYTLLRPIVVLSKEGQEVTIPSGAKVKLESLEDERGLCTTSWRGRLFLAIGEELRHNGMSLLRGELPKAR